MQQNLNVGVNKRELLTIKLIPHVVDDKNVLLELLEGKINSQTSLKRAPFCRSSGLKFQQPMTNFL